MEANDRSRSRTRSRLLRGQSAARRHAAPRVPHHRAAQISKKQKVARGTTTATSRTPSFCVSQEADLRIFLREPKEELRLAPGETLTVQARRPHLVTNGGERFGDVSRAAGIGEYDFVPLVPDA